MQCTSAVLVHCTALHVCTGALKLRNTLGVWENQLNLSLFHWNVLAGQRHGSSSIIIAAMPAHAMQRGAASWMSKLPTRTNSSTLPTCVVNQRSETTQLMPFKCTSIDYSHWFVFIFWIKCINEYKQSSLNIPWLYLKLVYDCLVFGFLFNIPFLNEISLNKWKITLQKSNAGYGRCIPSCLKVRHESWVRWKREAIGLGLVVTKSVVGWMMRNDY